MKTVVRTPSRIHLGLLDVKGGLKRMYGGVGVALNEPYTVVEVSDSPEFKVESGDERAEMYALRIRERFCINRGLRIRVLEHIPPHVGLGSGTQLALGIGYAMTKHLGMEISPEDLAKVLGRGRRSGVGIYSFKLGGFLVDGGVGKDDIPVLVMRYDFPQDWLFVVGIPNIERGFYGKREEYLLRKLTERLNERNECICETFRVLILEMIPALIRRDIVGFGKAITRFEIEVGRVFSHVQGDVFRSPVIGKGIEFLLENGAYGAGQSSWGPAFYGLVDEDNSDKLLKKLREFLREHGGGDSFIARANNSGAQVMTS